MSVTTALKYYIWPSSPYSFGVGVMTGLLIAGLHTKLALYLDIWISAFTVGLNFIILWGPVFAMAWGVWSLLQLTGAAVLTSDAQDDNNMKPLPESDSHKKSSKFRSSRSAYSYETESCPLSSTGFESRYLKSKPLIDGETDRQNKQATYLPSSRQNDDIYSFRPNPMEPALQDTRPSDINIMLSDIKSGVQISVLEKPVNQAAFRIKKQKTR